MWTFRSGRGITARSIAVLLLLSAGVVALPGSAGASVTEAPAPITNLTGAPNFDEVKLSWSGFGAPKTVVRGKPGVTAPTAIDDGFGVPLNLSIFATATASDLEPGTPYSFAAFACSAEDECAAPATVTVNSFAVTASVSPDRTNYTYEVNVTGQVTDYLSGQPIEYADVRIVGVPLRNPDAAVLLAEDYAREPGGRFTIPVAPPEAMQLVVFAFGDSTHLAGAGVTRTVSVSADTILLPVKKKGKLGTTFQLIGGAAPVDRTLPVVLQEKIKNKWKTLLKQKPNKDGLTTFKVKPKTKGKHVYRVTRAGTPGVGSGTSKQVVTITVT